MTGSAGSCVVVHLSDLHFGREDRRVVRGLHRAVWTLAPSIVAVSGDLTQRARAHQFVRARAFLDALPRPHVVVPGNHDVPLFNLIARVLYPLRSFTAHITRDLQPTLTEGPVWIAGINTTRPGKWKSGRVDPLIVDRLRSSLATVPPDVVKILVAHHPFDGPNGSPEGNQALGELIEAGIDVFLTGHLHVSYAGHTAHRYNAGGKTAVVVEAGTATSTRRRKENNAFNVLRVSSNRVEIELRTWEAGAFAMKSTVGFSRTADGWAEETGEPATS